MISNAGATVDTAARASSGVTSGPVRQAQYLASSVGRGGVAAFGPTERPGQYFSHSCVQAIHLLAAR
jgi:hypothetical protein